VQFPNFTFEVNLSAQDQTWIAEQKAEQRQFTGQDMCTLLTKALKSLPWLRHIALDAIVAVNIDRRLEVAYLHSFVWSVQWTRAFQEYTVNMAMTARPQKPVGQKDALEETEPHEPIESSRIPPHATSDDRANPEADFEGVSSLLRLMPNIEFLQVNMYPGIVIGPVTLKAYQSFLPTLFREHWQYPRLRELRILGVISTEEALKELILRHAATLQVLSFENVVLTTGSWDPIFATISRQAKSLVSLRLSLLGVGENGTGVNLEPVNRDLDAYEEGVRYDVSSLGVENFWHTRCIDVEEIRKGLRFRPLWSRSLLYEDGHSLWEAFYIFYILSCGCCR
jgi:hypothetical protein